MVAIAPRARFATRLRGCVSRLARNAGLVKCVIQLRLNVFVIRAVAALAPKDLFVTVIWHRRLVAPVYALRLAVVVTVPLAKFVMTELGVPGWLVSKPV